MVKSIILSVGHLQFKFVHIAKRIAYYDEQTKKVLVFLTNNTNFEAEMISKIYRIRWQIELLFKQLNYFLGDNVNAIENGC